MHLYLLTRLYYNDAEPTAMLVRARNERAARVLAANKRGGEDADEWLSAYKAPCMRIRVDATSPALTFRLPGVDKPLTTEIRVDGDPEVLLVRYVYD